MRNKTPNRDKRIKKEKKKTDLYLSSIRADFPILYEPNLVNLTPEAAFRQRDGDVPVWVQGGGVPL